MNFYAREQFRTLQKRLAQSYGVDNATDMFSVDAPKAVSLISQIQQSVNFLSEVSVIPVTDMLGDIITLNAPTSVASRTDTTDKEREPQSIGDLSGRSYQVVQTNYDVAIPYSKIDAFRRFSDFEQRILNMIYRRMGLDQLTIGWYGEKCEKNTNRTLYPLLQDVNHGWLSDLKTNKPENFVTGSKLTLGKGGDWANLDQLAFELLSLIPEEHRTGNERVLVGRRIVAWECGKIYEQHGQTPSEKTKFALLSKTYGGLPAEIPACFPDTGVMVVDPANLQIYVQENSIRRKLEDCAKRDRVEHYQSQNECYRIGDIDAAAAVDFSTIEFLEDEAADAPAGDTSGTDDTTGTDEPGA